MQLPKPTPLQSRLLASFIATCLVVALLVSFQPQHFVYAAELPLAPEDLGHSQVGQAIPPDGNIVEFEEERLEERDDGYVGEFAYFDRSLIGRAPEDVVELKNNEKKDMEMSAGAMEYFMLPKSQFKSKRRDLEEDSSLDAPGAENASKRAAEGDNEDEGVFNDLERRQNQQTVFISVNTCRMPTPNISLATDPPPQLAVYVSTSANNQKPGPDKTADLANNGKPFLLVNGSAIFNVTTNSDVYIGISAPKQTMGWVGNFTFEVAASVDRYYHSYYQNDTLLFMVDTDSESALFITPNLSNNPATTAKWKDLQQRMPFTMYAFPEEAWGAAGLENSFCGVKESFKANDSSIKIEPTMTDRYNTTSITYPKAQFHVQGLKANHTYYGFVIMDGNVSMDGMDPQVDLMSIGAGGRIFQQFQWKTKASDSCQVIFGLNFCSTIAYAVPSNSKFKSNMTGLAALYDDQAESYYANFAKSLAQVACDTTGTAQYSLAQNCTSCATNYKEWLCSVLMPRCEDIDATDEWLHPRNIILPDNSTVPQYSNQTNPDDPDQRPMRDRFAFSQSRNPMIDTLIDPGPYKELLPCEDLCFDIVRACPAQLQFACPNDPARSLTYGKRDSTNKNLTCNFPGAVVDLNMFRGAAVRMSGRGWLAVIVVVVVGVVGWM